jgi:hypothetical protein
LKVDSEKLDNAFSSFNLPLSIPVNVELPLAVGIPVNYISDQDLRLRLYRRIADLRDETELDALGSEFRDRFGQLARDGAKPLLSDPREAARRASWAHVCGMGIGADPASVSRTC